jgi:hypothetical protein
MQGQALMPKRFPHLLLRGAHQKRGTAISPAKSARDRQAKHYQNRQKKPSPRILDVERLAPGLGQQAAAAQEVSKNSHSQRRLNQEDKVRQALLQSNEDCSNLLHHQKI